MILLSDWDTNPIIDYDWFKDFFNNDVSCFPGDEVCRYTKVNWNKDMLYIGIQDLGVELNDNINEMMLFDPTNKCKS